MDSGLGFNIFTIVFLTGTFLAALVTGLGGFAFGIVAAAMCGSTFSRRRKPRS